MSWLEGVAVLVAILGIVYTILENRICWLINIIASLLYFKVFFGSDLPGQMLLQLFYVAVGFYGYIHWGKEDRIKIQTFGALPTLLLFIVSVVSGYVVHTVMPALLWADASLTIASIAATYLMSKKYLENWTLWIFINVFSIGLFIFRDLYLTSALYLAYAILAFIGYKQWSKRLFVLNL